MNNEACIALLPVPFESSEVGVLHLIILLEMLSVMMPWEQRLGAGTDLLLELLVDSIKSIFDSDTF